MPLLYGEGPRAFERLQEAIIQNTPDHSILAFRRIGPDTGLVCPLAPSPHCFLDSLRITPVDGSSVFRPILAIVSGGVQVEVVIMRQPPAAGYFIAWLDCAEEDSTNRTAIKLQRCSEAEDYMRPDHPLCSSPTPFGASRKTILLHHDDTWAISSNVNTDSIGRRTFHLPFGEGTRPNICEPSMVFPSRGWSPWSQTLLPFRMHDGKSRYKDYRFGITFRVSATGDPAFSVLGGCTYNAPGQRTLWGALIQPKSGLPNKCGKCHNRCYEGSQCHDCELESLARSQEPTGVSRVERTMRFGEDERVSVRVKEVKEGSYVIDIRLNDRPLD